MSKYKIKRSDLEEGALSVMIEGYLKSLECNSLKNRLVEESADHFLTALTEWRRRQSESQSWRHFLSAGALVAESVGQLLILSNRCLFNEFILKIEFPMPIDELPIQMLHEKSGRPTLNQIIEVIAAAKKQSLDVFYANNTIDVNELHSTLSHIYKFRNTISHPIRDYSIKQEHKRKIMNAVSLEDDHVYKLIKVSFPKKFDHIKILIDDISSEEKDALSPLQQDHCLRLIRDALLSDVNPSIVDTIVKSRDKTTTQEVIPPPKDRRLYLYLTIIGFLLIALSYSLYVHIIRQAQVAQNHERLSHPPTDMGASSPGFDLKDEKEDVYKIIRHGFDSPFNSLESRLGEINSIKFRIKTIKSKDLEFKFDNFRARLKEMLSTSPINHKSSMFLRMHVTQPPVRAGWIKSISCKIGLSDCASPTKETYLKQGGSSCPFIYKISTQNASSKIEIGSLEHLSGLQTLCFDPSAPLSIEMDGKPLCQIEGNSVRERVQALSGTLPGACADLKIKLKIDPSLDEQIRNQELSIDDI